MPETTSLFDEVAGSYDLLNTLLCFGLHKRWRGVLAREAGPSERVLDIATGTADVAIEIARRWPGTRITALDPSTAMLEVAARKLRERGLDESVELVEGVAEELPFTDGTFTTATIAFGIRNTVDTTRSLAEIWRVLKPGGKLIVLEFAMPTAPLISSVYSIYLSRLIPVMGALFGMRAAYRYLADSIPAFPQRAEFNALMEDAGFSAGPFMDITLGTVVLYTGYK